jgi:hypothetical protein
VKLTDDAVWSDFLLFLLLDDGLAVEFRQDGTWIDQEIAKVRNRRASDAREFLRQLSQAFKAHHQQRHVIEHDFVADVCVELLMQAAAELVGLC